jgi:hypothetical protein
MTGEVDEHHRVIGGERRHERIPHAPRLGEAVDEEQWAPSAEDLVGEHEQTVLATTYRDAP